MEVRVKIADGDSELLISREAAFHQLALLQHGLRFFGILPKIWLADFRFEGG
jgi:hypothetical protein